MGIAKPAHADHEREERLPRRQDHAEGHGMPALVVEARAVCTHLANGSAEHRSMSKATNRKLRRRQRPTMAGLLPLVFAITG